jgi:hypothetical protein
MDSVGGATSTSPGVSRQDLLAIHKQASDLSSQAQLASANSPTGDSFGSLPSTGAPGFGNDFNSGSVTGGSGTPVNVNTPLSLNGLDEQQKQVAKQIIAAMNETGHTNPAFQAGVLANVKAESDFIAAAIGDGGHSIGVFQLHTRDGAGKGYADRKDLLKDPKKNWEVLLGAERDKIQSIYDEATKTNDAAKVASRFCIEVERPADKESKAQERIKNLSLIT